MLLAYHKPKGAKDTTQDLPHVEALAGIGGSSASLQNIRPFESALLPVLSVPQWTGCVDVPVPGSAVAGAKKIGWVKARTPDFKWWFFAICQLPLRLGGSRTGKKDNPAR